MFYKGGRRRSRSRSRDKNKKDWRRDNSRSSSSSKERGKRKQHDNRPKRKRVRYASFKARARCSPALFLKDELMCDVKIFRKEDEPSAKALTNSDLLEYQLRLESENRGASTYFSPEELKHRESLMEGESMKKYREKEKTFNDKLMLAKEEVPYYAPPFLKVCPLVEGEESVEKEAHSVRISSKLGCYYSRVSEIPDEPCMSNILNNAASTENVRVIAFEHTSREDVQEISKFAKAEEKANLRPVKGILKRSIEEISRMRQREMEEKYRRDHEKPCDPSFMKLLDEIRINRGLYTKEQIEDMLKPYKQNGMLEQYLKRLDASKTAAAQAPAPVVARPPGLDFNVMHKPMPMMPVRSDKFKTVPCKYYNSPSGCQKKEECTFIHDEYYPAMVPGMRPPPAGYPMMMPKPGMPITNRNMGWGAPPMLMPGMGVGSPPTVNINLNSLNNNSGLPSGMNGMGTTGGGTGPSLNMNNLNPNNMTPFNGMPMNYNMGMGSFNLNHPYGMAMPPMPGLPPPVPPSVAPPFLPPTVPPPPPAAQRTAK